MYNEEYLDLGVLVVDFLKGVRKFKVAIICFSLAVMVLFTLYSKSSYVPMYNAQAVFTVKTVGTGSLNEVSTSYNFYYDKETANQIGTTFPYIIQSGIFKRNLKTVLDSSVINGNISATVVEDSNLVTLSVKSTSKEDALKVLEGVLEVYPSISKYVIGKTEIEVIEYPKVGDIPYNALNIKSILVKGFLFGMVASLGVVFVYALFRKTVRSEKDLKRVLNIDCLAMLPESKKIGTILDKKVDRAFSENIYSLQNRVDVILKNSDKKVLMITSTDPSEGKSTVSLNLSIAMASSGKRVVLLDGDLRKPDLAKRVSKEDNFPTVKEILLSNDLSKTLHKGKEGFYFIGNFSSVKNPLTIIDSREMRMLIKKLRDFADIVIIDSPPCGMLADAGHLYNYVDSILYIIRQDWSDSSKIFDSIIELPESGSKIIGCVLNMMKSGLDSYGYGYSHKGYGYGKDSYKYYDR